MDADDLLLYHQDINNHSTDHHWIIKLRLKSALWMQMTCCFITRASTTTVQTITELWIKTQVRGHKWVNTMRTTDTVKSSCFTSFTYACQFKLFSASASYSYRWINNLLKLLSLGLQQNYNKFQNIYQYFNIFVPISLHHLPLALSLCCCFHL